VKDYRNKNPFESTPEDLEEFRKLPPSSERIQTASFSQAILFI